MKRMDVISTFLEELDTKMNGNAIHICFEVNEGVELSEFLVKALQNGRFHYELVKGHINRDWGEDYYYEIVKHPRFGIEQLLIIPGNVWNGSTNLQVTELSAMEAVQFLSDQKLSKKTIENLFNNIASDPGKTTFYSIEPDFLRSYDESYESQNLELGYFECSGRDFSLGILDLSEDTNSYFHLFLNNGYG